MKQKKFEYNKKSPEYNSSNIFFSLTHMDEEDLYKLFMAWRHQ